MTLELHPSPDADAAIQAAAQAVIDTLWAAIDAHGWASMALSGGSTPRRLYDELARRGAGLDWGLVRFFWSDERVVPADHEASNVRLAREHLLDPLAIDASMIHAPRTELGAVDAAASYEIELRTHTGETTPRIDLVLLGMGTDGHTASLFPGGPELEVPDSRLVVASTAPFDPPERISFTLPLLNAARAVFVLALGAEKAPALERVRAQDASLPVTRVQPRDGTLRWFVDAAAAGQARD